MKDPWFLEVGHVLRIHQSLIDTYGGLSGIRDLGLLHSAVAAPQSTFDGEYLHGDLIEMATAYFFHLVKNHPFVDGNKRTGAASAIIFLSMNDVEIDADEDGLVDLTLATASGDCGKARIADFFRSRIVLSPGNDSTEPDSPK